MEALWLTPVFNGRTLFGILSEGARLFHLDAIHVTPCVKRIGSIIQKGHMKGRQK